MKIVDYFKNFISKLIHRNQLLLEEPKSISPKLETTKDMYTRLDTSQRVSSEMELPENLPSKADTSKNKYSDLIVNLIQDLSRIKTSRKIHGFGLNIHRTYIHPDIERSFKLYSEKLEEKFGKIDFLTENEIEQLDKKFRYSYFVPQFMKDNEIGIYGEDTITLLKKEMDDPELFKEYVLHNQDVPEEDLLKYKIDYIFENVHNFTDFNTDNMKYLENIRYYLYLAKNLLSILSY